jgi:hypothetical protein
MSEIEKVVIPANAKKPQDHKVKAIKYEAEAVEQVEIEYLDLTFSIDADGTNLDIDIVDAFENGRIVSAIKAILGPVQYAQFRKTKPRMKQVNDLSDIIAKVYGFDTLGE